MRRQALGVGRCDKVLRGDLKRPSYPVLLVFSLMHCGTHPCRWLCDEDVGRGWRLPPPPRKETYGKDQFYPNYCSNNSRHTTVECTSSMGGRLVRTPNHPKDEGPLHGTGQVVWQRPLPTLGIARLTKHQPQPSVDRSTANQQRHAQAFLL